MLADKTIGVALLVLTQLQNISTTSTTISMLWWFYFAYLSCANTKLCMCFAYPFLVDSDFPVFKTQVLRIVICNSYLKLFFCVSGEHVFSRFNGAKLSIFVHSNAWNVVRGYIKWTRITDRIKFFVVIFLWHSHDIYVECFHLIRQFVCPIINYDIYLVEFFFIFPTLRWVVFLFYFLEFFFLFSLIDDIFLNFTWLLCMTWLHYSKFL